MDEVPIFNYELEHKEYQRIVDALEAVGEAIIITERDHTIRYVNSVWCTVTGYSKEEAIGKSPRLISSGDRDDQYYDEMRECINRGEIWSGTFKNKKKDGTLFYMRQRIAPVIDEQTGEIVKFVGVGRDVTVKKNKWDKLESQTQNLSDANAHAGILMAELEGKNAELEKAQQDIKQAQSKLMQSEKLASIGTLAAGVAHEINNPIGFINGNFQVLEQYSAGFKKYFECLERLKKSVESKDVEKSAAVLKEAEQMKGDINLEFMLEDLDNLIKESQSGADRIKKIVGDLRTFARADDETMELLKIDEVLDSVINIVWNEIKYKAELEKDYGDIPLVQCNPQRMGQVFINLLINAAHAIEGKGKITVKTFVKDKNVCVEVADTGKGIPQENLKDIFDPFFTTKSVGQGTGLGLSISLDIIKQHNGEMTVNSEVGKGTTFQILLPIENGEIKE